MFVGQLACAVRGANACVYQKYKRSSQIGDAGLRPSA